MVEIKRISPYDFERLVIQLLVKMGYGSLRQHRTKTVLRTLPSAYLQIFRHFCPKSPHRRQPYSSILCNLTKNLLNVIGRQSLYGVALSFNSDEVTKKSGDEGIDGIISADRFGFDTVYVQVKQWDKASVGRPEIQKFLGALAGQGATKGLFITTSHFSKEAIDFANKNLQSKIVLVDGEELCNLMIEYDLGVSTVEIYKIKRIDSDYFNNEF